jgi:hypothetical protein
MRHVSPRLAELTAHAQALTSSGDLAGARAVLADALAPTDTDPQRASPALAEAAALHARILVTLGDAQAARDWAGFAHTAQHRLYGPDDERTLAATATHAAVLHRVGNHGLAARLYRDVVDQLTATDGADSLRVLAAQADLATTEHAAGDCADARARLTDAWRRHRRVHGDAAPAGIKMLARLGRMERDCGRLDDAREHLALAGEFCARYLPGGHPLTRQVAALVRAPSAGRHRCADAAAARGFPPDQRPAPGAPIPGRSTADRSGTPPRVTPPGVTPLPPTEPPGVTAVPRSPGTAEPGTRTADPGARVTDVGPGPGRAPDARLGRVVGHGVEPAGYAVPARDHGGTGAAPETDDDSADPRLPVPVHGRDRRRGRRPLVVAAVVTTGALAAGAFTANAWSHGDGASPGAAPSAAVAGPSATATAQPTGTAPATGPGSPGPVSTGPGSAPGAAPPSSVTLRDSGDSVALEWVYPPGVEGPVLISGGRTGQTRAFQQLPAGSTSYVVYGLNERADYCFTVAVVYSVDSVAPSAPVCTKRG